MNELGELLQLTVSQEERLKKKIHKEISDWKEAVTGRNEKLKRWNDLVEGVVEETDYPFRGASNIHVHLCLIFLKVYHTIFRRSILGSGKIWYGETEDEKLRESLPQIEDNLNYKAFSKWNVAEVLSDAFWVAPRDGLCPVQVSYVEEYEVNSKDTIFVENPQQFLEEFPKDSGDLSDEEWLEWQQKSLHASEDNPLEIPIKVDKLIYRGPMAEIVESVDFVTFPATAKSLSKMHCRGYGKRFFLRRGEIKAKRDDGTWYEEACNNVLSKAKKGSEVTSYIVSKDFIEGLQRKNTEEVEFFELVYRFELERGEGEVKLLLVYCFEKKELTMTIDYPYRKDFYALLRIRKKIGRLFGGSLIEDIEDANLEVDTLHNQRINSRKIAEVPSFKGKIDAKSEAEGERGEIEFFPGVVFWMTDPKSFEQFIVQPVDMASSMHEEDNSIKYMALNAGVEPSLFSGMAQRENPRAPGNKTQLLIQQSNMRMDDPIMELREGVEDIGDICLSHEYQFGPSRLTYVSQEGQKQVTKQISKRLLRNGIEMRMHGIDVVMNPEAELKKWFMYFQMFGQSPIIQQRVKSQWYLLMNAMRSGRIKDREKILPTLEELQKEDEEMKFRLMQRQQQEQAKQFIIEGDKKKKAVIQQFKHRKQLNEMMRPPMNGNGNGA